MKYLVNASRIRSLIADARTEKDIEQALRRHRIRYKYDTSAGYMSFRIPARSGPVLVFRTASRTAPFMVRSAPAASVPVSFPLRSYDPVPDL